MPRGEREKGTRLLLYPLPPFLSMANFLSTLQALINLLTTRNLFLDQASEIKNPNREPPRDQRTPNLKHVHSVGNNRSNTKNPRSQKLGFLSNPRGVSKISGKYWSNLRLEREKRRDYNKNLRATMEGQGIHLSKSYPSSPLRGRNGVSQRGLGKLKPRSQSHARAGSEMKEKMGFSPIENSDNANSRKCERLGNNQSEEHNAEQTSLEQLFEQQPPEPQPSGQPINEQPEQDLFKVEETPTDSANLNPYIGSYYGTKQGKAMDNLMLEMDGELVKPNEAMVILSGLKETSLRGPVMNCDSENNEVYMAPGRLGLRIFLALLNGQPYGLEGELTTREYAACMEMARRHANKRPCDVDSPPKPKPASCTKKYSPNPKKKTIENPPRFPSPEPQPLPTKHGDVLAKKGADQVKLVYVKRLFETDTKAHQDRLLMSPRHMKHKFLTAKEEEDFFMGYKMRVGVIGPDLKEFNLCFSMWGGKWYVITSRWRSLVESNGLKAGDVIQVWSFRVDGALEFVVHKMESSSKSGPKTTMDVVDCDDGEDMAVISGGSGSSGDNDH